MNRRTFIGITAASALSAKTAQAAEDTKRAPVPIIDSHIHLFDTMRPQGVAWPNKDDKILYRPALPQRYRRIAQPLGVTGAIAIEASPLFEDNQWLLDEAAKDTIIVAAIGNLELGTPPFRRQLDHFRRDSLFRGIRYGNLWGRDLSVGLSQLNFVSDLKALADSGLTLDTANPDPALISAVLRLSDLVPNLNVVIDHLPQLAEPADTQAHSAYLSNLQELGKRPRIYIKISEVLRRVNGNVPEDLSFYQGTLDELSVIFGPDRLIYGSDWPNSDHWASYKAVLNLVWRYFTAKGQTAAEKYFWKNSATAYRWKQRDGSQPRPHSG